jgi:hypothetical protein
MSEQPRGPTSAKEAALGVILGELGPMLDKVDTIASTLKDTHEFLDKDVTRLGGLVSTLEESLERTTAQLQQVAAQVAKAVAATASSATGRVPAAPGASVAGMRSLMVAAVAGGVLSAVIVGGVLSVFSYSTFEHARLGKAVVRAMPYMDPGTQEKLQAAIKKTAP